jgi:hypothetical protein
MGSRMNEYRNGILMAWQGEQWGRAFFEGLAEATDVPAQRAKWIVLAELEEATGNRLAALLGDDADPASVADLRPVAAAVAAYSRLDWPDALARMVTILDPAIERFRELLATAPDEDRETVQILFDHEVALKRFAECELRGDSKTSLAPVRAVIDRARA